MATKKTSPTAPKKARSTKQKPSKMMAEMGSKRIKSALRWTFWFTVKMTVLLIFVLFLYSIYLDGKVRDKFEGQRWKVPVQVYGVIEEYSLENHLTLVELKQSLMANRYKKVTNVQRPGEFALSRNRAIIYRRAFDFGGGIEAAEKVTIDLAKGKPCIVMKNRLLRYD